MTYMDDRVVVVTHVTGGNILKVCDGWETADVWVESSRWDENEVNKTGALVYNND